MRLDIVVFEMLFIRVKRFPSTPSLMRIQCFSLTFFFKKHHMVGIIIDRNFREIIYLDLHAHLPFYLITILLASQNVPLVLFSFFLNYIILKFL